MASNRGLAVTSDVSVLSQSIYPFRRDGMVVDDDVSAIHATAWDDHLVSTNWSTQLSRTENLNCWNNYGHGIQQSAECGVNLGFCSAWGPSG